MSAIRELRVKLARDYLAIRAARKLRGMASDVSIAHRQADLADTRAMLRAIRQAGCEDTKTPAYSIERERAIQVRADRRNPAIAVAHVKRNANGKLVKVDLAAGFCRDDGHDVPLAKQWADNAGNRAMRAILEAGQHRAKQRDALAEGMRAIDIAVEEAIEEHVTLPPDTLALMGEHGTAEAMTAHAAKHSGKTEEKRASLADTRARSALIRAELDAARAMASLSGKAKRKMRDQLRAARYAAR